MDSHQYKVLEFDMPADDFDPNFTPENGIQYLQQVVYERQRCPAVVVKPLHSTNGNGNGSGSMPVPSWSNLRPEQTNKSADAATVDRPDIHRPTTEWKQIQFAEFTQLRHQIAQLRPQFARRRAATAEAAAAAQSAGGADIELPDIESQSEWREFMHTNRPLLSTVLRLDQPSLETLLEYQLEWLLQGNVLGGVDDMDDEDEDEDEATVVAAASVAPISDWDVASLAALGRWIYSLLGCLHSPLEPSVHSTLRGIAKAALGIRNGLPTTGADATGMAAPLNLLVCIIAENFGQSDLSERV